MLDQKSVLDHGGLWLGALVMALLWMFASGPSAHAAAPARPSRQDQANHNFLPLLSTGASADPNAPPPLCRFGVNGEPGSYPIEPMRFGWFIDYRASLSANAPSSMDYYPMIRLEQEGDTYRYSIFLNRAPTSDAQLSEVIDAHPGAYWFVGNEPDRYHYQDDLEPHIYAQAYHDLYHRIKSQDPAARIVAGSIVQPTPVRLQYLDMVLASYYERYGQRMPVDVWAFHNFILNEANCNFYNDPSVCWGAEIPPGLRDTVKDGMRIDVQQNDSIELFKQQVIAFRRWLAQRGYREVPVFLSEYGVLMPAGLFNPDFTPERVNAYMNATFDFLLSAKDPAIGYPGDDNRLVQRFSWYSVDDTSFNGFLFDPNRPVSAARTSIGSNLAGYTAGVQDETDLEALRVGLVGTPPLADQGATTVTLQAIIANSGNLAEAAEASVAFYDGDPAAGGVLIGESTVQLAGCGERATAQVEWPDVAPGQYQVYVQVDGDNQVHEVDEGNNRTSGVVAFTRSQLFIPAVSNPFIIP
ncbi:MAG TPA: CARDB domain-containing protein [Caldilineaceae bacterium]|nr:CARDB domain-containing protein [Caldilineaceae bacterium]